ncbi:hypothetical protein QVD17_25980 [Tagetes erecta]|uniref:Uncharacterized protein n=1 Tax=Tagetes erecta TaxID=13708 RepID=A0AAD8K6K7_TARER|nr:hypothetical protein QVD17_25980 [Tagetes erecta]
MDRSKATNRKSNQTHNNSTFHISHQSTVLIPHTQNISLLYSSILLLFLSLTVFLFPTSHTLQSTCCFKGLGRLKFEAIHT